MTQPYQISVHDDYESWVNSGDSNYGNSAVKSIDVGLARWTTGTGGNVGIWSNTRDDISFATEKATAGTVNSRDVAINYANDVRIDKCEVTACLRNNSNIGVLVDIYYAKRKKMLAGSSNDTAQLMEDIVISGMQQSYDPPATDPQDTLGYAESLYDFPILCARLDLKKVKSYIHYPAETKFFKIKSPIAGKTFKPSNALNRTADPRWHRGMVFVFRGLPVHNKNDTSWDPGNVTYGAWKMDVITSRIVKYRLSLQETQDDRHIPGSSTLPVISTDDMEIQPAVNPSNAVING